MKKTYLTLSLGIALAMPINAMEIADTEETPASAAYTISEKEQNDLDTLKTMENLGFSASYWMKAAAQNGHAKVVEYLLSHFQDDCLNTGQAFSLAAKGNHVGILQILFTQQREPITQPGVDSGLYYATREGAKDAIQYLLNDAPITASKGGISYAHNFTQSARGYSDIATTLREAGRKFN